MLMPKKTKFRKQMRGRMQGDSQIGNTISFGSIGLQAIGRGYITTRQIEAARRVITRTLKRGGKTWIRVFPDKPVTKRPAETRMGKGKGSPDFWTCCIQRGQILFELDGVSPESAYQAFRLAQQKLPVHTQFVVDSLSSFRPTLHCVVINEKRKDL